MTPRMCLILGSLSCGMAVALGAFAAHGLDEYFAKKYAGAPPRNQAGVEVPASLKYLNDFKTGAEYQMTHGLGLLIAGCLGLSRPCRSLRLASWSFFLGIVFFSGALYVLTLTGQRWLGMIAPIGGTLFIVGWAALAWSAFQRQDLSCGEPLIASN